MFVTPDRADGYISSSPPFLPRHQYFVQLRSSPTCQVVPSFIACFHPGIGNRQGHKTKTCRTVITKYSPFRLRGKERRTNAGNTNRSCAGSRRNPRVTKWRVRLSQWSVFPKKAPRSDPIFLLFQLIDAIGNGLFVEVANLLAIELLRGRHQALSLNLVSKAFRNCQGTKHLHSAASTPAPKSPQPPPSPATSGPTPWRPEPSP